MRGWYYAAIFWIAVAIVTVLYFDTLWGFPGVMAPDTLWGGVPGFTAPEGAEWYVLLHQVLAIKWFLIVLLVMLVAIFCALMDIGGQLRKGGKG